MERDGVFKMYMGNTMLMIARCTANVFFKIIDVLNLQLKLFLLETDVCYFVKLVQALISYNNVALSDFWGGGVGIKKSMRATFLQLKHGPQIHVEL